jgi:hypothetical protein
LSRPFELAKIITKNKIIAKSIDNFYFVGYYYLVDNEK